MLNLNNKGQSLVMFIVIIPILIFILTLIYDIGSAVYDKNNLSNTNYMVIDYGLDNIDTITENELIELIRKNSSNINRIDISIDDGVIDIILIKNIDGVIGKVFGFNITEVVSEYKGELVNNKKKIERIK